MFFFSIAVGLNVKGQDWVGVVTLSVGTLFVVMGFWEKLVRLRAHDWPTAQAIIDAILIIEHSGKSRKWTSRLDYSFLVFEKRYTGRYSRTFPYEDDAQEWLGDHRERTLTVHYWPRWPALSLAFDEDVELLLKHRLLEVPTAAQEELAAVDVSHATVILSYAFMTLAVIGFFLSLYAHLGSMLGRVLLPQSWLLTMHAGAVVSFFPALLLSPKQGKRRRTDPAAIPGVLGGIMVAVLVYALGNFAWFMIQVAMHHNEMNPVMEWRGFSGHWMFFYVWSFAFLYPAAHPQGKLSQSDR
jgi:hypothetical protein